MAIVKLPYSIIAYLFTLPFTAGFWASTLEEEESLLLSYPITGYVMARACSFSLFLNR
jgi:hypothetical protein